MENVILRELDAIDMPQILQLYRSVGWSAYYTEPEKLENAFRHSLYILGAYDEDRLIGLIRTVGDGLTIVFIQDILIAPAYQRKGIGRRLVAAVLARYRNVRQIHLLTDDTPQTVGFYRSVGFSEVELLHFKAFTKA